MGKHINNKDKYIENLEWVLDCYKNKSENQQHKIIDLEYKNYILEEENKKLKDRLNLYGYIHQD